MKLTKDTTEILLRIGKAFSLVIGSSSVKIFNEVITNQVNKDPNTSINKLDEFNVEFNFKKKIITLRKKFLYKVLLELKEQYRSIVGRVADQMIVEVLKDFDYGYPKKLLIVEGWN